MIKFNTKHRKNLKYLLTAAALLIIFLAYTNLNKVSFSLKKQLTKNSLDENNKPILVVKKDDIVELFENHLKIQNKQNKTTDSNKEENPINYDFVSKYPRFLECKNKDLPKWSLANMFSESKEEEYAKPAKESTHALRITRAILLYFPTERTEDFLPEFRWLYRSWIEMQKSEPLKWRTDLVVFIDKNVNELNELNCSYQNTRKSDLDEPMCTFLPYKALKNRRLTKLNAPLFRKEDIYEYIDVNKNIDEKYEYLLNRVDIFSDEESNLLPFLSVVQHNLQEYSYLDSILIAFEGYDYLKKAKYDFVIRSDIDVFLTPLFSKWIPVNCNDFAVGGGGYSVEFNMKRLRRIANNLKFEYAGLWNLGSTWYSTPDQFRLVAYFTLFGMAYIGKEEFTLAERQGKVGTELWPEWHHGVLLLYGQNLAMNHLIGSKQINVPRLFKYIDQPATESISANQVIHIHVYHGLDMFSKFEFKSGKYDNMTLPVKDAHQIKSYCLKMALESKRAQLKDLVNQLKFETRKKV